MSSYGPLPTASPTYTDYSHALQNKGLYSPYLCVECETHFATLEYIRATDNLPAWLCRCCASLIIRGLSGKCDDFNYFQSHKIMCMLCSGRKTCIRKAFIIGDDRPVYFNDKCPECHGKGYLIF